jgi:phosphatidylglycerol phospholipase C
MFHDPALDRTTNSTGRIKERTWYGDSGMQHVRTIKEPKQAIPTFAETVELLMKPENKHVKFNVDVKVQNDPERLFSLMQEIISAQPAWQTDLAPRILLGLWHPRFLQFAKLYLPNCRRSHIGVSTFIARKYFWKDCEAFSMSFGALTTYDGQKFREECKSAGKNLVVWTVNEPEHMMEAVRWEVHAIITDVTQTWLNMRTALQADYEKIGSQYGRIFLWTTLNFYTPFQIARSHWAQTRLENIAGPFDDSTIPPPNTIEAKA